MTETLNPLFKDLIIKERKHKCSVCANFHFPDASEVDGLCTKHLLQLWAALELGKLREVYEHETDTQISTDVRTNG